MEVIDPIPLAPIPCGASYFHRSAPHSKEVGPRDWLIQSPPASLPEKLDYQPPEIV